MKPIIKAGLVGRSIKHSLSPFIQERLFRLSGKKLEYHVLDISDLQENTAALRDMDVFNVTIPYKQEIIPMLDEIDEKAKLFGSVNTVIYKNGRLIGYTTDGVGCTTAIERAGVSLDGKILILGNGGAARAIAFEILFSYRGEITIAHRENAAKKAEALIAELKKACDRHKTERKIKAISYTELEESTESYDVIINATSVGMYPNSGYSAVSENVVKRADALFDAVYNPEPTHFLGLGRAQQKKLISGMDMLVYQAVEAHKIWYGSKFSQADIDLLIEDAKAELKKKFPPGNIILCGFMGSGKTVVGKAYAKKANMNFCDLDKYIEEKAGMEISEIFEKLGEESFRKMETEAAKTACNWKSTVIAVGGGAVLREENLSIFRKAGRIIFLDTPLSRLQERLRNDKRRPLLQRPDRHAFIAKLHGERYPLYKEAAEFTVTTAESVDKTVERIEELGL